MQKWSQHWSVSPSKRPKNGMSNACVHSTNYIFNTAWFEDLFWYKKCLPAIETSIISRLDIALAAPKKQSFDFLDERGKRSRNDNQLTTRSVRHCSRREDDIVTYSAQYSILGSKIWLAHWKTPALDRSYTLLGDKLLVLDIVFIIWLTRTGNYQIHEFDWPKWILTAV